MTNPTPHGQVPEALIDLIDAYAETRHRCGGIYNARTEAARKAVIEALSGGQALSAAPANHNASRALQGLDFIMRVYEPCMGKPAPDEEMATIVEATKRLLLGWWGEHRDTVRAMLAASPTPTPPAEQQAAKETSGGFHVWRDISTAPKDGSRFVAIGYNYGLYSEGRHICVAQWFRGCWMETSDWNEASELKHLTHWLPLPSPPDDVAAPAEQQAQPGAVDRTGCTAGTDEECTRRGCATRCPAQQAAPKAAPGEPDGFGSAEHWKEKAQYWAGVAHRLRGEALRGEPVDGIVHPPAPQQEAQEPVYQARYQGGDWQDSCRERNEYLKNPELSQAKDWELRVLYTAPQPAPAPLSEMPYEKRKAIQEGEQIGASDAWFKARHEMLDTVDRRNVFRAGFDRGWSAALAAQGGKA